MKIGFATCVQLGLSCIEEIYRIGGRLDLLITLNDNKDINKSGRIFLDSFSKHHNVPLVKINNINDKIVINKLKEINIDWLFIIGWSQIAKTELLNAPKLGCIGMHPTLLPLGRGRAAIPWAILKGLNETGVTAFKLDEGVDTGPIIGQVRIPIKMDETATDLYEKVNAAHITLISEYWAKIKDNDLDIQVQNEAEATYWPGRKPEDGEIYNEMTMLEADRMVRAVTKPYPGAFHITEKGVMRIWTAKTTERNDLGKTENVIVLKDGYLIPLEYEYEM